MYKKSNVIDRKEEIKTFINMLVNKNLVKNKDSEIKSFNVVLHGRWGDGKTTFLKQLIKLCEIEGENSLIKHENIFTIKAWDYDYLEDPLEMINEFLKDNSNRIIFKKILDALVKVVREGNGKLNRFLTFFENIENVTPNIKEVKNAKCEISKITDSNDDIYIFIDDLDRCNPNFVIKLIEITKQIFNTENIIIIYMLDWDSTNISIMNHYGLPIKVDDNEKYLSKIIDYRWDLPHLSKVDYLFVKHFDWRLINHANFTQYMVECLNNYTFREVEKIIIKLKIFSFIIFNSNNLPSMAIEFPSNDFNLEGLLVDTNSLNLEDFVVATLDSTIQLDIISILLYKIICQNKNIIVDKPKIENYNQIIGYLMKKNTSFNKQINALSDEHWENISKNDVEAEYYIYNEFLKKFIW